MNDTIVQNNYFLNDSDAVFWTLVVTVLAFISTITIFYIQYRRERKKLASSFREGKWFRSQKISYDYFRDNRKLSKYFHRENIEKIIKEEILNKNHIVITGSPLRGKTRTMVECIKQLKNISVLIPYPADFNKEVLFPRHHFFNSSDKIVIFNDLQKFFEPGKDPRRLFDKIIEKGWIIVANCRTVEEWRMVRNIWGISSDILKLIEIPKSDESLVKLVADLNGICVPPHYDGKNIGTLFVDLDEIRLQYETRLTNVQKQILKAIKELCLISRYNFKGEILSSSIKQLAESYPLSLSDTEWFDNLQILIDKGFVSGNPNLIIPEQVIIDRIVEPDISVSEIVSDLIKVFPKEDISLNKLIYTAETPEKAAAIIGEFRKAGIEIFVYHYNLLLSKVLDFEQGMVLLEEMRRQKIQPDVITYTTLLNSCKEFEKGRTLMDEMRKDKILPDIITYNSLLKQCKESDLSKALLEEIRRNGIKPDIFTFNILLHNCIEYEQGKEIFEEMKRDKVRPNAVTYNALLNLFKDFDQGKAFLLEMRKAKIQPDVITYNTLIKICKDFDKGKALLVEMIQEDIQPDVITYNSLINSCKEFDEGKILLHEMRKRKIQPDVITYNTLLNICKDFELGIATLDEMRRVKIQPDVITYSTLLGICIDFDQGRALLIEMSKEKIQPNVITYTTLLGICREFEQGKALIDEMREAGILPNVVTYSTLLNMVKRFEQGMALLGDMMKQEIQPNVYTYSNLLEKVETEENLIDWINSFCSTSLTPNSFIVNGLQKNFPLLYESARLNELFSIILRFNPLMFFGFMKNFETHQINGFIAEYTEQCYATDFNKLGFANYYLYHEEPELARNFLDAVKCNNYYYYKYWANYWYYMKDYSQAEENLLKAVSHSENHLELAKALDMLSLLVKEQKLFEKTGEAIEYCKRSISTQPESSPTAKQLLVYFTVEFSPIENILEKLENLKKEYCIGKRTIKIALEDISDEKKTELIKDYMKI